MNIYIYVIYTLVYTYMTYQDYQPPSRQLLSWSARPRPCAAAPCARPRPVMLVAMAPAAAKFLVKTTVKRWKHGWKSMENHGKLWKLMENHGNHCIIIIIELHVCVYVLTFQYALKSNWHVEDIPTGFSLAGRHWCQESMRSLVLLGQGGRQLGSACPVAAAPGLVREMADLVIFLGRFDAHSNDHGTKRHILPIWWRWLGPCEARGNKQWLWSLRLEHEMWIDKSIRAWGFCFYTFLASSMASTIASDPKCMSTIGSIFRTKVQT